MMTTKRKRFARGIETGRVKEGDRESLIRAGYCAIEYAAECHLVTNLGNYRLTVLGNRRDHPAGA